MDFFEHTLGTADRERSGAFIWVRDSAYTRRKDWLDPPLTRAGYEKAKMQQLYLRWIDDQFVCGDSTCESENVVCIWYRYDGIDLGVDQTFGEFYCRECGKYTFVEYQRDSS